MSSHKLPSALPGRPMDYRHRRHEIYCAQKSWCLYWL